MLLLPVIMPMLHVALSLLVFVQSVVVVVWTNGAALPNTVTAGFTNSINDTVPTGGTKLDTLTNAGGNVSAVFHAEGLQFAGALTINCPTAVAD